MCFIRCITSVQEIIARVKNFFFVEVTKLITVWPSSVLFQTSQRKGANSRRSLKFIICLFVFGAFFNLMLSDGKSGFVLQQRWWNRWKAGKHFCCLSVGSDSERRTFRSSFQLPPGVVVGFRRHKARLGETDKMNVRKNNKRLGLMLLAGKPAVN